MKVKDGFVIRNIAGQYMAVPVGKRTKDLHGMIALNETGAFLWNLLREDQSLDYLIQALLNEYDVSPELARSSILEFLDILSSEKVLLN